MLAESQLGSARDALRIARVQYPAQLAAARAQQQAAAATLAQAWLHHDAQRAAGRLSGRGRNDVSDCDTGGVGYRQFQGISTGSPDS